MQTKQSITQDEMKGKEGSIMEEASVFTIASRCFAGDEDEFAQVVAPEVWSGFLERIVRGVSGDGRQGDRALSDFLASAEVSALKNPPRASEHGAFCRKHFTGGLPESAMPVESLYHGVPQPLAESEPFTAFSGAAYLGESATYMRSLIERMGFSVPQGYEAWPDHLSLELDMLAVLLRSGAREQASIYQMERFGWLADYRQRLLALHDEGACFYLAVLDVVIDRVATEGSRLTLVANAFGA